MATHPGTRLCLGDGGRCGPLMDWGPGRGHEVPSPSAPVPAALVVRAVLNPRLGHCSALAVGLCWVATAGHWLARRTPRPMSCGGEGAGEG